jgi:hypothetical protein
MLLAPGVHAAFDKVTTYQDANGWKLQVNGEDFYVKGFVWGYTPRGENYSYNLWDQPEELIKAVLDHDFGLMAKAGVTANRSFTIIPPKWVTYIYETYGIMSVINPLMGRYGASIDGVWVPFTDYSDPRTREILQTEVLEIVEKYKDVPGVLMFALGNESNYGLSWSSFEIEDLPVGEQYREKAKFLYSLFGETIRAGKEVAPEHLFTIVNGDIQYLDLIAEYAPEMDVLGINAYRGISFEDKENNVSMWRDVKEGFDRPVVFMEFGSDAFNARDFAEDQPAQASYLRGQWQEIYKKSYGNGEEGNAIGGFVFEWRDEWWKYKQTENLDKQDRTASWANGGYKFDHVEGQNNMNEEWFGVARLGNVRDDGVYEAEPRMAYDVLKEIWKTNPYQTSTAEVNEMIRDIDMDEMEFRSDIRQLKIEKREEDKFRLAGGSFSGEMFLQGLDSETKRIRGDFSINVLGPVANSDFEQRYQDRGTSYTVEVVETEELTVDETGTVAITRSEEEIDDDERIEIYDFQATYEDNDFDLNFFYHVPRYHWGYEGDFYGLLRETTDLTGDNGQDIWNAKAPYGVEYVGKGDTYGLKVVAGPEVYWGANPKIMAKYQFGDKYQYAIVASEDIARRDDSSSATEATTPQSREITFYAKNRVFGSSTLEWGGIVANGQKHGDEYDRIEDGEVRVDEIETEDTIGVKAKLTFEPFESAEAYVAMNYAGLVADGGNPLREWGTELPYTETGNKKEIEAGIRFDMAPYTIYPRVLYRENIVDANDENIEPVTTGTTLSPGLDARNTDEDPFAVLDNREATSAEVFFTYDPTPSSWFYDWNVDMIEDAPLAFNIGLTATEYGTGTDSYLFFLEEEGTNAAFGDGLEEEDVWGLKSKWIINPNRALRYIADIHVGKKQSTGQPDEDSVEFFSLSGKVIVDKTHIYEAYVKVDDFGPYDFQRQFNIVYPLQLKFEYARLLDAILDEDKSSKVGVKFLYRELDEDSPEEVYLDGENEYEFEVQTYFKMAF